MEKYTIDSKQTNNQKKVKLKLETRPGHTLHFQGISVRDVLLSVSL